MRLSLILGLGAQESLAPFSSNDRLRYGRYEQGPGQYMLWEIVR